MRLNFIHCITLGVIITLLCLSAVFHLSASTKERHANAVMVFCDTQKITKR